MAAAPPTDDPWGVVDMIGQSPPVNCSKPYDTATLAGKTIIITGGASGFGAAFARHWAGHGSHIIIGDVNDRAGEALIAELRTSCPSPSSQVLLYQHCDVTSWSDQLALFNAARAASPTGAIDAVVAGAGIVEKGDPLNPSPKNDRHLLLVSSIAGVSPLPGQTEYTTSKHAVMGLFRALRATAWTTKRVRVNVLNPYFVATPLLPPVGLALLAGGAKAELEDVVDAATRFVADEAVRGRALVVGPKMRVRDEGEGGEVEFLEGRREVAPGERVQAVWEIHGHDYERVEVFVWRYLKVLNIMRGIQGWVGLVRDLWGICFGARR